MEALNDILQQFREAELGFGKCHTDSDQDFSSEILFTVNDPAIIKSKRLPKTVTKRKPDIIALFIARIKMILSSELKDMPYGEYITAINLGERAKGEVTAPTWVDVLQSWELKAEKRIDSTRLSDPYDRDGNSNAKDDDVLMKEETLAEGILHKPSHYCLSDYFASQTKARLKKWTRSGKWGRLRNQDNRKNSAAMPALPRMLPMFRQVA